MLTDQVGGSLKSALTTSNAVTLPRTAFIHRPRAPSDDYGKTFSQKTFTYYDKDPKTPTANHTFRAHLLQTWIFSLFSLHCIYYSPRLSLPFQSRLPTCLALLADFPTQRLLFTWWFCRSLSTMNDDYRRPFPPQRRWPIPSFFKTGGGYCCSVWKRWGLCGFS